jgi:hypothetical protein
VGQTCKKIETSRESKNTHPVDAMSSLDHLDLSDIICPSLISKNFGNLTTNVQSFAEQGNVNLQPPFVAFEGLPACFGILSVFKLRNMKFRTGKSVKVSQNPYDRENIRSLEGHFVNILGTLLAFRITTDHISGNALELFQCEYHNALADQITSVKYES